MSQVSNIDDVCLRASLDAYIDAIKKLPTAPPGYCYIPIITSVEMVGGKYQCNSIIDVRKMTAAEMIRLTKTVVEPPDRIPDYQVCTAVSRDLMEYLKENQELITVLADQIVCEIKKEISRL